MNFRILYLPVAMIALASTALADEVTPESIFVTFDRGGYLMYAILAASIIGCAFTAERLWYIRKRKQIPERLMAQLRDSIVAGGVAAGKDLVEKNETALGRVMHALLAKSGATRRELENTVDDEGSRVLYDLRANLRPIGIVATVSPMLGLLGTVFGLIAAFRSAAELGMDDPRNFAAGIYEALYTTAFGLVVAIPLLSIYHALRNHADNILREVEERALAFIADVSSRAERASGRPATMMVPDVDDYPVESASAIDDEEMRIPTGALAASDETSVEGGLEVGGGPGEWR